MDRRDALMDELVDAMRTRVRGTRSGGREPLSFADAERLASTTRDPVLRHVLQRSVAAHQRAGCRHLGERR